MLTNLIHKINSKEKRIESCKCISTTNLNIQFYICLKKFSDKVTMLCISMTKIKPEVQERESSS